MKLYVLPRDPSRLNFAMAARWEGGRHQTAARGQSTLNYSRAAHRGAGGKTADAGVEGAGAYTPCCCGAASPERGPRGGRRDPGEEGVGKPSSHAGAGQPHQQVNCRQSTMHVQTTQARAT